MAITRQITRAAVAVTAVVVVGAASGGTAGADEYYGEFTVGGRILEAYKATGGADKWGTPTSSERPAADGGRFQTFSENTSFYWKASVTRGVAHQIGGAIRATWGRRGFERGALGWPITDELDAAGTGRKQLFQGGNVYYSQTGGTRPVWGEILSKYAAAGGPGGRYGLPTSDEFRLGARYAQDFAGGRIVWP